MCFEDSRWYFKSFAFMSLGDITLRVDLALSWWTVMQWETEVPLRGFFLEETSTGDPRVGQD